MIVKNNSYAEFTLISLLVTVIALTAIFNSGLRPGIYEKTFCKLSGCIYWIPGLRPE